MTSTEPLKLQGRVLPADLDMSLFLTPPRNPPATHVPSIYTSSYIMAKTEEYAMAWIGVVSATTSSTDDCLISYTLKNNASITMGFAVMLLKNHVWFPFSFGPKCCVIGSFKPYIQILSKTHLTTLYRSVKSIVPIHVFRFKRKCILIQHKHL